VDLDPYLHLKNWLVVQNSQGLASMWKEKKIGGRRQSLNATLSANAVDRVFL
jgi:hypothetical protein